MDNDYTRIAWSEVRKGDVLFHENGDRLTVRGEGERLSVAGLSLRATWQPFGFTPYRRKPELPTTPGAYMDKDGDLWKLADSGGWWMVGDDGLFTPAKAQVHAPFTRLVPMPSSDAVLEVVQRAEPMCRRERITDAVMALLNGEGDDERPPH